MFFFNICKKPKIEVSEKLEKTQIPVGPLIDILESVCGLAMDLGVLRCYRLSEAAIEF